MERVNKDEDNFDNNFEKHLFFNVTFKFNFTFKIVNKLGWLLKLHNTKN